MAAPFDRGERSPGSRVRQRTICYLGRLDNLQAPDWLRVAERLPDPAWLPLLQQEVGYTPGQGPPPPQGPSGPVRGVTIDPHSIAWANPRRLGEVPLGLCAWLLLGLDQLLARLVGDFRTSVPLDKVAAMIAVNRLVEPKSERGIQRWPPTTALPELLDVPRDRIHLNLLYRCLSEVVAHKATFEKHPRQIETSREPEADLTQEGAIVGTPIYMPPEQAMGDIDKTDERSDIYALGAILYEMLTLQPPIEKEGGYMSILMRVVEGQIIQPEQRTPHRAIPRELSAIAMKALAQEKKNRYQTVELLRRDIERFQEGRSVSAKEDTGTEMIWKFVKRNKGASMASAAALVVIAVILFYSFKYNYQARLRADDARAEAEQNLAALQERTDKAVPALVEAARLSTDNRKFDKALEQLDLAIAYDEKHAPAHLLKGQVLIGKLEFEKAQAALQECLRLEPDNVQTQRLHQLCYRAPPEDGERLLALARVLLDQKVAGPGYCLLEEVLKLGQLREKLLPLLRQQIEGAWPGLGSRLSVKKDGSLHLDLTECGKQVVDLSPLRGMPLTSLSLQRCSRIRSLTPLTGMPLTSLDLDECLEVRDLWPLQGMPLTSFSIGFAGGHERRLDLTPLKGMPLTSLNLRHAAKDLTPLQGMPLTSLNLFGCQADDLTPLRGMPLTWLNLSGCPQLRNLTPLGGMKLRGMHLPGRVEKGMTGLRKMTTLDAISTDWRGPAPGSGAAFWKEYDAGKFKGRYDP